MALNLHPFTKDFNHFIVDQKLKPCDKLCFVRGTSVFKKPYFFRTKPCLFHFHTTTHMNHNHLYFADTNYNL